MTMHPTRFLSNNYLWNFLALLPFAMGLFSPGPAAAADANHLASLGIKPWHDRGFRGQGMKVAILDSGFRGYQSFLGKGLPDQVKVRSFRKDHNLEAKDSQHGILCAEVVHSLAPEAELFFANWEPDEPAAFLEAVRWVRSQGIQLMSCSCIMPNWSDGDGGGAIHEELSRLLGTGKNQGDLLFFACIGNTARRHWRGLFQPDADGFHQWSQGQKDNALTPWGTERVSVELYCRPGATFEVLVQDGQTGAEVARSVSICQGDRCSAAARFQPQFGQSYSVRVRVTAGNPGQFHVVSLQSDLNTCVLDGSICFPGDGKSVVGVGAVDKYGLRQSYSACGPNSALPKPDLVAPVPITSQCRPRPFAGTSAATPQAAALAALLWSSHPNWSADRVRTLLLKSAHDLGPRGHDRETGHGLIHLSTPD